MGSNIFDLFRVHQEKVIRMSAAANLVFCVDLVSVLSNNLMGSFPPDQTL